MNDASQTGTMNISEPIARAPDQPLLMGILNLTPESFSDGGQFLAHGTVDVNRVVATALTMASNGADIIDFGAEATSFHRPGVVPVPSQEQIRRLSTTLKQTRRTLDERNMKSVALSIDTRSAEVAKYALEHGASIINDVSGGRADPAMLGTAAAAGCPIILMHAWQESPDQTPAQRMDVLADVVTDLQRMKGAALAAGVKADRIILDPGIGFGKAADDNWRILRGIGALRAVESPIVLGFSRKRITRDILPSDMQDWPHRDIATAIIIAAMASTPVAMLRVHDIRLAKIAIAAVSRLKMAGAVETQSYD